ncbi:hypothetical protein [Polymorphobacter sp.]|uniref:hypothetical protein n=1 Tax=Polymorphobacter sp. TaxID=1909290 RepID=UPI003F6F3426
MSFLNPSAADRRSRYLKVGGASIAITALVIYGFLTEHKTGYLGPDPKLIYAESWPETRTREDAIADTQATIRAREQKLAEARAYIATLSGQARIDAQAQYDAYVDGGGARKEIPYVPAEPPVM